MELLRYIMVLPKGRGAWTDQINSERTTGKGADLQADLQGEDVGEVLVMADLAGAVGQAGAGKMLDVKELRILILFLMEQQPRHGYDIIRELESRTGGAYAPSPGIVYPTLSLLEDQGEISTNVSEGPRRLFVITDVGREALKHHRGDAEVILERLSAARSNEGEHMDYGPVGRAVGNLHAVIKRRFTGGEEKSLLFEAADLIDEVSRKIERL